MSGQSNSLKIMVNTGQAIDWKVKILDIIVLARTFLFFVFRARKIMGGQRKTKSDNEKRKVFVVRP